MRVNHFSSFTRFNSSDLSPQRARFSRDCSNSRSSKFQRAFCGFLLLVFWAAPAYANDFTVQKVTTGGVGTFNFTVTGGQNAVAPFSLTTVAENTPSPPFTFAAGANNSTYSFSETMPGPGWTLVQVTCPAGWTVSGLSASGTVNIFHPGGQTGTCTFFNKFSKEKSSTNQTIRNFLNTRVGLLASEEPDRARMLRRFDHTPPPPVSLKDQPLKLGGPQDNGSTSFSTSLSATREYFSQSRGLDLWTEAHFQRWGDNLQGIDRTGDFSILYVGADYLLNSWVLVGALVQFDWMTDNSGQLSTSVRGDGWMAGPYATVKLTDNIFLDARGAWGTSTNDITPSGIYKDSFDMDRWLAKTNLTGTWFWRNVRISPSAGVVYVEETQKAYRDSQGTEIDEQSVHLGRFTFGPELGYPTLCNNGLVIEPHVALLGMWDFDKDTAEAVDGVFATPDSFHVRTEGGLIIRTATGMSGRVAMSYDGIGSNDFHAWGGQLWLSVPLIGQ
jgi:hypothetical protein